MIPGKGSGDSVSRRPEAVLYCSSQKPNAGERDAPRRLIVCISLDGGYIPDRYTPSAPSAMFLDASVR